MTEKIKTMGKIEYGLGVVYGIIIAAYSAGLPVSSQVIIVAILFTVAYFGHWAFLLLDKIVENRIILARLESERITARESVKTTKNIDTGSSEDSRFIP